MSTATVYDLLGIDPNSPDRAGAARALLLPLLGKDGIISLTPGYHVLPVDDSVPMIGMLQQGLVFTDVHPGVSPAGHVAVAGSMAVTGPLVTQQPFYLRALPDHGIQLVPTDPLHPAQLFFVTDGQHRELIIDGLPVKIFLKAGLASTLTSAASPAAVGTFDTTKPDSFAYTLGDATQPAEIDCFVRLRLTPEDDVIIETSVPISFGPVRWMGIPATAVYDVSLIPSPNRREYFEWTRNDIGSFLSNPPAKGAVAIRSIDIDFSQQPFTDLKTRLQGGAVHIGNLELVLEDIVMPASVPVLPVPSHGTFGFRRLITDRTDIGQAYSLSGAPVQIVLYSSDKQAGNGSSPWLLQIEEFFFATGDIHAIDPASQPQVQFQGEIVYQSQSGVKQGAQMGIDAEWTVTAGYVIDIASTPVKFTIADTTIGLVGVRFGVSIGRLAKNIPFSQSFLLLGDFYITAKPPGSGSSFFQLRSLTGKPLSIVAKDLGWRLGHLSLDGLQFPDGMQLIFADKVRIIIEEAGWVEEPNGTPYFSFSGGVALGFGGGQSGKPQGNAYDNDANGFGIRVRRLRFRTNDDTSQPLFKIDGMFLKIKVSLLDIEGFGYISDYTDSGWSVREWGFGVTVKLGVLGADWTISGEFIKGVRRQIAAPGQQFDYFLAAVKVGFLPAGAIGLYDVRALFADNMAPNLDSTFPDGEGMALLKWHQSHDQALDVPANRTLSDWIPEQGALAIGAGCGFSINGCGSVCHLDVFIFFAKSKADTGLLIVGDVLLLQNPKPIAFVAIEYDISSQKFGVMAGANLTAADLTSGAVPGWVGSLATLSGNLYFGNQPWQFAIGQLADQSTWLGVRVNWDIWLTVKFEVAVALQVTDGGPKGIGFVTTLSSTADWGIGTFTAWGSFGFILGTWKTGSTSMGAEIWLSLGFKINLFYVFGFGAEIGVKMTYLGRHPWFLTLHGEIRIDTPWFLPDVTFAVSKTWQSAKPFDTSTLTSSLSAAAALDPAARTDQPLLMPGLSGAPGDAAYLYTFNQLNGRTGIRIPDPHTRDDIPLVSVDATMAVNLAQPVSNDSLIATATAADAGVQQVQDLTARYGLASVAVRRAPRFGPTAGQWTDFVTDAQAGFSAGGVAPQYLTFAWDHDLRADGTLAAKRLLVNSSSPYSFTDQSDQNDQESTASDPDFPCCGDRQESLPIAHVLTFGALAAGSRAPRVQRFSNAGALWTWATASPPVIAPGDPAFPGSKLAWAYPLVSQLLGAVDLPEPAAFAEVVLTSDEFPGVLYLEAYDGLTLVGSQTADLHTAPAKTLQVTASAASRGISRLTVRVAMDPGTVFPAPGDKFAPTGGIGCYQIAYYTMAEYRRYAAGTQRCKNPVRLGPPGSDASGKLAWLPNHDYEIVITTSIALGTKTQSTRSLKTGEALYFRTKALPGLNACENTGDDIRRHVDTTYPARRLTPLYRQEPCVLAFENSLSSVLPIDRAPGPGDPPEKAQMFPLELNIDRVASTDGMKRLTVPSNDWILAHRANPYPPVVYVAGSGLAVSKVRYAPSADPLVQRYEAVRASAASVCGPQPVDHASQVLLHEPIDAGGNPGLWEAGTSYRATARQQDGPYAQRSGFDVYDLGAFIMAADGGAAATLWSVDGAGNLVAPVSGAGRNYAACGELTWDHLQVRSLITLASASAAGIAVGVAGGTPVPWAVLATVEPRPGGFDLVVRRRAGGAETELGRAAVTVSGPFLLEVTAYDDVVRARVGDVTLDGPRGAVREGRVALVAHGPATFAGIAVDALDIYAFEFVTSSFASFAAHMGSWDGRLPVLAAGALGAAPTPAGTVLAAHAADLPALMTATAGPQERQRAFDAIAAALGIGLRKNQLAVTMTRLTDANGTYGLAVESPEPVSLTRDVTVTLIQHTRVWVSVPLPRPGPGLVYPGPGPVIALPPAATTPATVFPPILLLAPPPPGSVPVPDPDPLVVTEAELAALTFGVQRVSASEPVSMAPGDLIVRVAAAPDGARIDVYDPPSVGGALRESLTAVQAARQPIYVGVAGLPPGAVTVLKPGGATGHLLLGHWTWVDTVVPLTAVTNGDETKLLLLSGTPLGPGDFTLRFVLDRDRWQISTGSDPEQHYHDQADLTLQW